MQPGEEEEEEIAEDDDTYQVPRHPPPLRGRGGPIHRPVVPLMPRGGTGPIPINYEKSEKSVGLITCWNFHKFIITHLWLKF